MKKAKLKLAGWQVFVSGNINNREVAIISYSYFESKLLAGTWRFLGSILGIPGRTRRMLKRSAPTLKRAEQVSPITKIDDPVLKPALRQCDQSPIQCGEVTKSVPISSLPIVFIHSSNSDFLQYTLHQAKRSNPDSPIYLIGDESNDCYDFLEHYCYSDFFEGAREFGKIYRHFNTTGEAYEVFNFQRWFILRDFLSFHNIASCLYLDSDSLLYVDITEDQKKLKDYDFTLSVGTCGNTFYLNRAEALTEFCQFLMNIYTKKDHYNFDRMLSQYYLRSKNGLEGGACDMTAFNLYAQEHFNMVGELTRIVNGAVYDPNINLSDPGFVMDGQVKRIKWNNGFPFGTLARTGEEIRFNSLHFQGSAKRLIKEFYLKGIDSASLNLTC